MALPRSLRAYSTNSMLRKERRPLPERRSVDRLSVKLLRREALPLKN
jgi:hypothetical protein